MKAALVAIVMATTTAGASDVLAQEGVVVHEPPSADAQLATQPGTPPDTPPDTPSEAPVPQFPRPVFEICFSADGVLTAILLATSSGNPEYDDGGVRILRAAQWTPPDSKAVRAPSCRKLAVKFQGAPDTPPANTQVVSAGAPPQLVIKSLPDIRSYTPAGVLQGGDTGRPSVHVCMGKMGELLEATPSIAVSSGTTRLDEMALKYVKAGQFQLIGTAPPGGPQSACKDIDVRFDVF